MAKDHLGRCLTHEPDFYPALSRLGEISMLDIDTLRAQLLIKQNAGEAIDYAVELVPYLKEAAAFWTASLAIEPAQPATQLALATLYLQLSEVAPLTITNLADGADVRRAYLTKARDIAHAPKLLQGAHVRISAQRLSSATVAGNARSAATVANKLSEPSACPAGRRCSALVSRHSFVSPLTL
jgi:hypothetical protein